MRKSLNDFDTENELLIRYAENGFTESMLKLSIQILINRTDEKRISEAYKWLFLAKFLGDQQSDKHTIIFQSCMTESQIEEGEKLVDTWVSTKQTEFNENIITDWSRELLELWTESNGKLNFH